ncbi:MAG: cation transporter [Gemmatimonadetes bacterium]|nr:cation transporter [Gemmatimonadota bacterium]
MTVQIKLIAAALAAFAGTGVLCPLCGRGVSEAGAQSAAVQQASDTATVRLHISQMTCGSCPVTARLALKQIPGVLGATVTLDDSLGVVRYDRRKVTPAEIAAHLTRQTGYPARVLADASTPARRTGT